MINNLRSGRTLSASDRPHPTTTRAGRALVLVGVLAIAGGMAIAPSVATGESTSAQLTSPLSGTSKTFTWSYVFDAGGGHDLSNIAVGLCSTDLLAHVVSATPAGEVFVSGDVPGGHTAFGPGIKFATTAVAGTLTLVFDQAYAPGGILRVQSHSGDGSDGDLVTTAAGPGDCAPTTTTTAPATTTTLPAVTTTTAPATTTTLPAVTTTTAPATTTTLPAVTTTTAPATTTTLPAVTTTTAPATTTTVARSTTSTAPATTTTVAVLGTAVRNTTTTVALTTSTSVPTSVLGNRFVNDDPADLAKTGFDGGPLVAFGALCLILGAVLLAGGRLDLSLRD